MKTSRRTSDVHKTDIAFAIAGIFCLQRFVSNLFTFILNRQYYFRFSSYSWDNVQVIVFTCTIFNIFHTCMIVLSVHVHVHVHNQDNHVQLLYV